MRKIHKGKVLDVASGTGCFAAAMLESASAGVDIFAVDTVMKPLRMITSERLPGVLPAAMDGMKLAFRDSVFQGTGISNSLHHLKDPVGLLHEMKRVLKPGGLLIVNEMFSDGDQSPSQITHTMMHNWWGAVDRAAGNFHNSVYPRKKLEILLESAGVTEIEMEVHEENSGDPHGSELRVHLEKNHKIYMQRAAGNRKLEIQGEKAWRHFEKHGFAAARSLTVFGIKPYQSAASGRFYGSRC